MRELLRAALVIFVVCGVFTAFAMAATESQKMNAINQGLANLAATQLSNGSWAYSGYEQASTGAALLAFLSQKGNWGSNASAYQTIVDNGIAYLLANASTMTVSTRNDGVNICPGGTGSCIGVYWYGAGESTYTTGLVAPPIALYGAGHAGDVATVSGPLAGMTWGQIAQGITNEFSASQSSAINGNRDGGWRYYIPGNGDSDTSTTQWAVLALLYDQSLGAGTPATVKDHLKSWLAVAQVSGQGGAGCYQPDYLICEDSDTGALLLGLKFVGYDLTNTQVINALGFLNNNWLTTANNTWYGNFGHPYAMWGVYKGLEATIGLRDTTYITSLYTNCGAPANLPGNPPGSVPCNWWEDYNDWLVNNQSADGSWAGYAYWTGPLSTSWDISILGATPVPVGNPVLDDFNRANGALGANWSGTTGVRAFVIQSNQVWPWEGGTIYWNHDSFGTSQEAFVTLTKIDKYSTNNDLLLKVQKAPNGTINYKRGYIEVNYNHKKKFVTLGTQLPGYAWISYPTTIPVTFSPGDKFGAKVLSNGEVHVLKNGAEVGMFVLNTSDQAFFNPRGGYIGLYFMNDPDGFFDDFGGGSL